MLVFVIVIIIFLGYWDDYKISHQNHHVKFQNGLSVPCKHEINYNMNHAPDAGLITQPVNLQSSMLQLPLPPFHQILSINLSKLVTNNDNIRQLCQRFVPILFFLVTHPIFQPIKFTVSTHIYIGLVNQSINSAPSVACLYWYLYLYINSNFTILHNTPFHAYVFQYYLQ